MRPQVLIGGGTVLIGAVMAIGASQVHGEVGYAGIGPSFLPWFVSGVLALCGVLLMFESIPAPAVPGTPDEAHAKSDFASTAWVSAGLLLNAALINSLGFILSCALLFALAARGFRRSMGQPLPLSRLLRDAVIGILISAPVYWMFTKGLGLTLPGLTRSGWL